MGEEWEKKEVGIDPLGGIGGLLREGEGKLERYQGNELELQFAALGYGLNANPGEGASERKSDVFMLYNRKL